MTDSRKTDPRRMLELKVGLFIVGLLIIGGIVVFMLGGKKHVFEQRVLLHTKFKEVAGLRDGAPVRLSGVNVGLVVRIAFSNDPTDTRVRVDMEVARESLDRIRKDSVARIGAQGLLGDKIVEIVQGSASAPAIESGGTIEAVDVIDFSQVLERAAETIDRAKAAANSVAILMEGLSDPKSISNLRASLVSVRDILHAIEKGPGLAHAVFYEESSERAFQQVSLKLAQLIAHADSTVGRVDKLLASTNDQGMQVINHLAMAAKTIGETANELGKSKIIAQVAQASADLAQITRFIKSGRGSVGGIIVDPTLYHQLVSILGGVERSRVLRAVVRYAIGKDEDKNAARTIEPPPSQPKP